MRNKVFLSRLDVLSEYIDAGSQAAGANRKRQGQDAATTVVRTLRTYTIQNIKFFIFSLY